MLYSVFRRSTRVLFLALLMLPPALLQAAPFEAISKPDQPEIILRDLEGQLHKLQNYRGKVVLVNFWATWCTPCITELPELTLLQQQLSDQPFQILTINVGESRARVNQFVNSMGLQLPVLLDKTTITYKEWDGRVLPTSLLFDSTGKVRFSAIGNPGWDYQPTLEIIDNLIREAAGSLELTRAEELKSVAKRQQ